eukprot:COSAG02_NODE_19915_length_858_cov_1.335968_1_plen_174_part_01
MLMHARIALARVRAAAHYRFLRRTCQSTALLRRTFVSKSTARRGRHDPGRSLMPAAGRPALLALVLRMMLVCGTPAAPAARQVRSSRWWFHTLNSSYTALGTAIVRSHLDACTGVYLYMDTYSTHGCAAANAAHMPCGRFSIGTSGHFSSATDAQIAERVRPYQDLGVTVTVSM